MSKVHEIVTSKIIEHVENGNLLPWQQPWSVEPHRNLNSGHKYRGINTFLLQMYTMEKGYDSPFWCTFNGAKKAGGYPKKGESAHIVVFYKSIPKKLEDGSVSEDETVPLLRYYKIFNVEQCEDVEVPKLETVEFEANDRGEEIINYMPNAPVIKFGGASAYYIPKKDEVHVPKKEKFTAGADSFYLTTFHELVHSTGHESRLNREEVMETDKFAGEKYSREELTAEIGACFLGSHCGFDPSNLKRSASYVESWLKVLKDDSKMIVQAAAKAQNAADYILGEDS